MGRPATRREVTALALALGGVLVAVALGVVMVVVARGGDVEVRLGSEVWEVGRADRLADAVASDGPLLVQDLSGGDRDIYVSHVGEGPETGWHAFAARTPGSDRDCSLVWDAGAGQLRDPCSGAVFPPEGEGLEQYPVFVEDGDVVVDINRTVEGATTDADGGDGGGDDGVVRTGTPAGGR